MTDRRARTRSALGEAALDLAASFPLDDITVTALAQRAGVTRETFYQYSASVVDVLADALATELAVITDANSTLPATLPSGDSVFRAPTEQLVDHLVARYAVYRHAMAPHLHGTLRVLLTRYVLTGLLAHLDAHPTIAPAIDGRRPDAFGRVALATYAAAGTVSVLEEWLASPEPVERRILVDAILSAAPEWWQGRA